MAFMDRAARMERHHARQKKGSLNLVSLMDIFTILVFFLLVNSSDVEVLPNAKDVQLPESTAEAKARESVVILVTDEAILVQGRPISRIDDVLASDELVIPALRDELVAQTRRAVLAEGGDIGSREVTIMGDKEIPYRLLKRVMATCTEAEYGRLSLAVLQKSAAAPAPAIVDGG